ncbi:hypothetical protein Gbth_003_047 [Gluconobacter thailandicus F149-1 = NBRC 100600]|nr:hypothetical protein Gbfr_042_048 [Gluconobacter frateurii M-2]GAN91973.1 hypothetical protein Gbth_003_047 [Gluconobacter thailandicus F149-1 = NBRC 100600]GBR61673.1 hypothetical protein AA100600_3004 [Gluconobacter thailandicus F149-1 = NBRC 100600]GEL87725.1 hypothetical protein GTH01_20830 [Gluconobacter thailandicus F149-1 = NBRC 100600]
MEWEVFTRQSVGLRRFVSGLSRERIAQGLGIEFSTLKTWIRDARAHETTITGRNWSYGI